MENAYEEGPTLLKLIGLTAQMFDSAVIEMAQRQPGFCCTKRALAACATGEACIMKTFFGGAALKSYLAAICFVGFVIYGVADNFKYALIWPVAAYLHYQASRWQCVPIIKQNLH